MELWKPIKDFPGYEISDQGNVRSYWAHSNNGELGGIYSYIGKEPKNLIPWDDGNGYLVIKLSKDGNQHHRKIHRLIAEAFIPNPKELPVVRHLDDNPRNNSIENLAWGTQKDNMQDSIKNGKHYDNTSLAVDSLRKKIIAKNIDTGAIYEFDSLNQAARVLGLYEANISKALTNIYKRTGRYTFEYSVKETKMGSNNIINSFPGYEYKLGEDNKMHNMYRGTDLGFGGYVYAEPGMYVNVALLDVSSMHPASIVALNKLGEYTQRYADLRQARVYIKHHEYDKAGELFDGKLKKYLTSEEEADALANALKYPLNAFYGLCSAKFENPAKDSRDVNNIVALRGAAFMRVLQDEIIAKGFRVVHIKTDSCKVPNATPEIISFIQNFAKKYGYEMEHECTYEKLCLVNDAVYIAKYDDKGVRNKGGKHAGEWTATGAEFQIPYIFKSLFSHEPLEFKDYCVTKEVKEGSIYIDMNENLPEDEHNYKFVGKVGEFCPITPGKGGGVLYRMKDGKYYAVTGTKGYRWLDSETVRNLKWENRIDNDYFKKLVDDAVDHIKEFGDFEWFVSDDPVPPVIDPCYIPDGVPEEVPFDEDFPAMNKPVA